ncbi:MAG: hypothetical protein R3296_04075 [Oleiphilaceae bacterium]|nr:hypothetical protein [Oleiphilaceae bacterium]
MSPLEWLPVVLVLLVAASILFSTVRYGMSPMPSLGQARRVMVEEVSEAPRGPLWIWGPAGAHWPFPLPGVFPTRR